MTMRLVVAASSIDNLGGRRDVALNILRPSVRLLLQIFTGDHKLQVRLKHVDDVIQTLIVDLDPVDIEIGQLANSESTLNSIAQDILESLPYADSEFSSLNNSIYSGGKKATWMRRSPEDVVRFFDSAIQILQYTYNDEYIEKQDTSISWSCMKKDISDALNELGFLRNLLWMLGNDEVEENQGIPGELSLLFCSYFAPLVGGENLVIEFSDKLDIAFPRVRERIYTHARQLHGIHRSRYEIMDTTHPSKIINQEVLDFFDRLIDNLGNKYISSGSAHQMETAIEELRFLRSNLLDILEAYSQEEMDSAVKEMECLTFSTLSLMFETAYPTYFSRSPYSLYEKERATEYWSSHLPDLIDAVDLLKQQASDLFKTCRIFCVSSSSCNPDVESLNCFVNNLLEELTDHKAASIAPLKHQIETYYREMVPIRDFLASEHIAIGQMENSQMGFLMARFIGSANQARFIIDSFLAGEGGSLWSHKLGMFVVTNEVKMTYMKMKTVLEKMKGSDINGQLHISSHLIAVMAENPLTDIHIAAISSKDEMKTTESIENAAYMMLVGARDSELRILEQLTGGSTNLKIISIVGMPGLGKTTVANSVYQHPSVSNHFHVRAWCCVSQVYNRETLLADLLSQVVVGKNNSSLQKLSGHDLAQMLYRNLKGRKYLIVIDDIWDIKVWMSLRSCFPIDDNGSRILFTTRHHQVARKANSVQYYLRLLSDKESRRLLCFKVFDRETCPPELSVISKRIARNCKGLPLAVILIAGILRRTERSKESWEQVAEEIKRLGVEDAHHLEITRLRSILELSYKHLPLCLRPCFLYFAAFPEDTCISVSKLIQLWISEGFLQEKNLFHKSLEEEAESYLGELIDRSLVMIAKRSSNGGVKACRVHDVLRVFCSSKFKEEMKEEWVDQLEEGEYIWEESTFGGTIRLYRRSIMYYNRCNQAISSGVAIDSAAGRREQLSERSVFSVKLQTRRNLSERSEGFTAPTNQPRQLNYGLMFQDKFLRVLDLRKVRIENSADTCDIIRIATLVHLRFLGIRPLTTEIPAEIGNLRKLETLVLTGTIGYVKLPESLWNLSSLRHVLMDHGFFDFQHCSETFLENFSGLYDLKSVSTLSLRHGDDVANCILRKLPWIQKLACRFWYSWDDATGCCLFPALNFLIELESLKVFFFGMVQYPCKFSFPSNLKKLSLSNSRLPWDEISVIARQLPNLEVLKLLKKAFEGRKWIMGNVEFPKLKFLKLESLYIKVWNAEAEHFPCLAHLVVQSCPELEEIPGCFGEISTLQSIEMKWCSSSAMDSVKQILQIQRDFSNDQFKVTLIGSA